MSLINRRIEFYTLTIGLLLLCIPSLTWAQMVCINSDKVNIRSGPSTNSKVKWVLGKGFPLKVIASKGQWLKVKDFEDDVGWVYKPLTSRKPHMVVKKKLVNIRSGPGEKYKIVAQARYGVVFRTIKQVKGWAKIKHQDNISGWVARKLIWGW